MNTGCLSIICVFNFLLSVLSCSMYKFLTSLVRLFLSCCCCCCCFFVNEIDLTTKISYRGLYWPHAQKYLRKPCHSLCCQYPLWAWHCPLWACCLLMSHQILMLRAPECCQDLCRSQWMTISVTMSPKLLDSSAYASSLKVHLFLFLSLWSESYKDFINFRTSPCNHKMQI